MATPFLHGVLCKACGAKLGLMAEREDVPRTSTRLQVKCPKCTVLMAVEVPLAIKAPSVRVAINETPLR